MVTIWNSKVSDFGRLNPYNFQFDHPTFIVEDKPGVKTRRRQGGRADLNLVTTGSIQYRLQVSAKSLQSTFVVTVTLKKLDAVRDMLAAQSTGAPAIDVREYLVFNIKPSPINDPIWIRV